MHAALRIDAGSDRPVSEPPALRLTTLGALRLVSSTVGEDVVIYEGANKALALFTYLACAPGRGATRAHLQELLWERQAPEAAQQSLRTYLWKLRKLLPPEAITGDEFVVLHHTCDVDRDALVDAANRGDADTVVARYTGEFFPSYTQPDSPQFDAWVQSERLRLRGIYSRCAERVIATAIDGGRFREAIEVGRNLRDSEPLDEAGWRPLLNALLVSGDSVNAANESAVLLRTLTADGREPMPATASLLSAIARMSRLDNAPDIDLNRYVTPLIARDREYSQLLASWTRARDGAAAHVHLRGSAGMGKSRLLDDFATRLQRERAAVVRARADIGRRALPYAFIGVLAAQLASRRGAAAISPGSMSALLAINPALSSFFNGAPDTSTGDEALRRRTLALSELIAVLSDEQPLAIVLDDVQWADSDSCRLLAGAFASSDAMSCLLITAAREGLPAAFAESRSDTMILEGLGAESVIEVLQSLATLPDDAWAMEFPRQLHEASGGLPLHIFDALRLATERGVLKRDRQTWQCADPSALAQLLEKGAPLPRRIEMLTTSERHVLLRLAVAGVPCENALFGDEGSDAEEAPAPLTRLERLGYVTMDDGRWCIAHDAITEAIISRSAAADVRGAHESLAVELLAALPALPDVTTRIALRTVIAHGVMAESTGVLRVAFGRYVSLSRRLNDRRRLPDIADDALGDLRSARHRATLIASLPPRARVRDLITTHWRPTAAVASVAVIASLLGAYFATRPTTPAADGYLAFIQTDSLSGTTVHEVPMYSSMWTPAQALDAVTAPTVLALPNDPSAWNAVPTGALDGSWVGSLTQTDSGTTDLFLFDRDQKPRRLTFAAGDDVDPSMAPDGRLVAFSSARWSPDEARSIAILDLRAGTVSRLIRTHTFDESPTWSPDGRRVAFTRREGVGGKLCVVTVDGRLTECPDLQVAGAYVRALAWHDDSVLLATVGPNYARVHVDSASVTLLDSSVASRTVSPDGRWLASIRGPSRLGDAPTCEVAPALAPHLRRFVRFSASRTSACPPMLWSRARGDHRFVAKILLDTVRVGPYTNVPYQLTARAIRGPDTTAASHMRWTTSDTTLATVTSAGLLQPRRAGVLVVHASYGGWRSDSARLTISVSHPRILIQEEWHGTLSNDWVPFGDPKPKIVSLAEGTRALLNNGDGTFQSGVHSRVPMPIDSGLALDTWVSVPVTMDRSQGVRVGLYTDVDSVGLAHWNHKDGWAFTTGRDARGGCEFQYPAGLEQTTSYISQFAAATYQMAAPLNWAKGEQVRVRLQLFPDGRCGAAVNGRVVGLGAAAIRLQARRAYVYIYGNSPGTLAVVGPVTISKGVADGIEWKGESSQGSSGVGPTKQAAVKRY